MGAYRKDNLNTIINNSNSLDTEDCSNIDIKTYDKEYFYKLIVGERENDKIFCKFISALLNQSGSALSKCKPEFYQHIKSIYWDLFDFFSKKSTSELSSIEYQNKQMAIKSEKIPTYISHEAVKKTEYNYGQIKILTQDASLLLISTLDIVNTYGVKIEFFLHPVIRVKRDAEGGVVEIIDNFLDEFVDGYQDESLIFLKLNSTINNIQSLKSDLSSTLELLVKRSFIHREICGKIANIIDESAVTYNEHLPQINSFKDWLLSAYFVPFGVACYNAVNLGGDEFKLYDYSDILASYIKKELPVTINLSSTKFDPEKFYIFEFGLTNTSIARSIEFFYYIDIKSFDEEGRCYLVHRVFGVFMPEARVKFYNLNKFLDEKTKRIIKRLNYKPEGFGSMIIRGIIQNLPIELLLTMTDEEIGEYVVKIDSINSKGSVIFIRKFENKNLLLVLIVFGSGVSEYKDSQEFYDLIAKKLNGKVVFSYVGASDSGMVFKTLFIITNGLSKDFSEEYLKEIELYAEGTLCDWSVKLLSYIYHECKKAGNNNRNSNALDTPLCIDSEFCDIGFLSYITSKFKFPSNYRNAFEPERAYIDMKKIQSITGSKDKIGAEFVREEGNTGNSNLFSLRIYSLHSEPYLSDIVPIVENMAFKIISHNSYCINFYEDRCWVCKYTLSINCFVDDLTDEKISLCEEIVSSVLKQKLENSVFNKLSIVAGINGREIFLLTAISAYLKQVGQRYSQEYISACLAKNYKITCLLVRLFNIKFCPIDNKKEPTQQGQSIEIDASSRQLAQKEIVDEIDLEIANVENIAEDAILRNFFELINQCIVRTNFFHSYKCGCENLSQESLEYESKGCCLHLLKDYVSFKVISSKLSIMPSPKPYAEIFVYSNSFEGIHLRGGKIARGGIRWSDRKEDYRTEVLGLMKAQMSKNSIIVPVGAKGGFIVRSESDSKDFAKVIESYQNFLRGLLDITDNIKNNLVIRREGIVALDEEDSYLVVAADKGTATFSDYANEVSNSYDFWMSDAFASGGSFGYDHKMIGITAKGAWSCAKNHLCKIGIDPDKDEFSVLGIGDMSGDVFGNGMLLSKNIKLLAAFNHIHIFIDPDPVSEHSWEERNRLFQLPKSSWSDYGRLSKNGVVFSRTTKRLELNPTIMSMLDIESKFVTPDELIKKMLCMRVDLIWNGGIGTYIKSESETNEMIADKSNDDLRVNGNMVRSKIIVEGGNLGVTQLGRIEYAKKGGLINTDFIDNCGGVNCSDREVNMKIALATAIEKKLINLEERNKYLLEMTNEVSAKVIQDSSLQTEAISIAVEHCKTNMFEYHELLKKLTTTGVVDAKMEFLPSEKEIIQDVTENLSFVSPILCVLSSYSKIWIFNEIANSEIHLERYFERYLFEYFPTLMKKKFQDEILSHKLKAEIISNYISNIVVNKIGITFVNNIVEMTGARVCDVLRSFMVVKDSFSLFLEEDAQFGDNKLSMDLKILLFIEYRFVADKATRWLIREKGTVSDIKRLASFFAQDIRRLEKNIDQFLSDERRKSYEILVKLFIENGLQVDTAKRIASLRFISNSLSLIEISKNKSLDIVFVAKIHSVVENILDMPLIENAISNIDVGSYRKKMAINSIIDRINHEFARITNSIVENKSSNADVWDERELINKWIEDNSAQIASYKTFVSDFVFSDNVGLDGFVIIGQKLESFY